jgi:Lipocalin-like domain
MNRRRILTAAAITMFGSVLLPTATFAQTSTLKDRLVGAWTLVSEVDVQSDGKRIEGFGTKPLGTYMFDAGGHFVQLLVRADLPKYANRLKGTPEQEKAVAEGLVAYYGTYTVNEADKVIAVHIVGGSFATFNGTDGKRIITSLTADELKLTNPANSTGTSAETVWTRAN